jgi:hypothetical protein
LGKDQSKGKKKCCRKYLKTGKHCKNCPLLLATEGGEKKNKAKRKKDKEKKGKKKK